MQTNVYICSTLSIFQGLGLDFNQDLHFSCFFVAKQLHQVQPGPPAVFFSVHRQNLVPFSPRSCSFRPATKFSLQLLSFVANFSTLHCESVGTLGGVPFEVFVQIPAQIVNMFCETCSRCLFAKVLVAPPLPGRRCCAVPLHTHSVTLGFFAKRSPRDGCAPSHDTPCLRGAACKEPQ